MKKQIDEANKKSRRSWYFYDFGNSAYASVVLLAVYSAYFKNAVVGGAEGTRLWGISVGVAAVLVAIVSPILGTIADFTKFKKKFLLIFTALSCHIHRSAVLCPRGRRVPRHALLHTGRDRLPRGAGVL